LEKTIRRIKKFSKGTQTIMNYILIGFLALQTIAFLTLLLGYFMSSQRVYLESKSTNPLFNHSDWFNEQHQTIIFVTLYLLSPI